MMGDMSPVSVVSYQSCAGAIPDQQSSVCLAGLALQQWPAKLWCASRHVLGGGPYVSTSLSSDVGCLWRIHFSKRPSDILTWAQCYAALVGPVLSKRYPQVVPSLIAYQVIIIKASREFEGVGWVQYNRALRRQAAITKEMQRGKTNTTLSSICASPTKHPTTVCPESMDYGLP